jgi:hypothetical protein
MLRPQNELCNCHLSFRESCLSKRNSADAMETHHEGSACGWLSRLTCMLLPVLVGARVFTMLTVPSSHPQPPEESSQSEEMPTLPVEGDWDGLLDGRRWWFDSLSDRQPFHYPPGWLFLAPTPTYATRRLQHQLYASSCFRQDKGVYCLEESSYHPQIYPAPKEWKRDTQPRSGRTIVWRSGWPDFWRHSGDDRRERCKRHW